MMALLWMTNPLWEAVIAPGLLIFAGWWMRDLVGWLHLQSLKRGIADDLLDACGDDVDYAVESVEMAHLEARVVADDLLEQHDGCVESAIVWCNLLVQKLREDHAHG